MVSEPKWKEAFPPAKKSTDSKDRLGRGQEPPQQQTNGAIGEDLHEMRKGKMATEARWFGWLDQGENQSIN